MSYYRWYAAWGPSLPPPTEEVVSSEPQLTTFDGAYELTEPYGAITVSGGWVLPAPKIPSVYESVNKFVRSESDRTFRWQAVVRPANIPVGLDFRAASRYQLQITPDLGYQNPDELFQPYDIGARTGNSRLLIIDDLQPGVDVVQTPDHLTYTISESVWSKLINPRFHRYLWRVVGLSDDGVPGFPSDFFTFEVLTGVPNAYWAIDDVQPANGITQVITGTKNSRVSSIQVLGQSPAVSYPTPTTWRLELPLSGAKQTFFLRAVDEADNTSAYRAITIERETATARDWKLWNSLDELGQLVATPRLDGESNSDYRTRLLDVYKHRGSPRYQGLRNALTRDLELLSLQADRALTITRNLPLGQDQTPTQVVRMMIGPIKVHIWGDQLRKKLERHIVDGHTWSITPQFPIEDAEPILECPLGSPVSPTLFSVNKGLNSIQFRDSSLAGKEVYVSYRYRKEIPYLGMTVQQLADAMEAITIDGVQVLNVSVNADAAASAAAGLDQIQPTAVLNAELPDVTGTLVEGVTVRWSPIRLYSLTDQEYEENFLNEWGHLFSTNYDGWADQLRSLTKQDWGHLVADKAFFQDTDIIKGGVGLRTTMDIAYGFYKSSCNSTKYDIDQFIALGGICPLDGSSLILVGVPDTLLKSGVGSHDDLIVRIKSVSGTLSETPEVQTSVVQLRSAELTDLAESPEAGQDLAVENY